MRAPEAGGWFARSGEGYPWIALAFTPELYTLELDFIQYLFNNYLEQGDHKLELDLFEDFF